VSVADERRDGPRPGAEGVIGALNAWLDQLPRTRFGSRTREVPAFRTIGVGGFYLALFVTMGTGIATGRSAAILAVVSVACGLSFFAWALVRRLVVRRESFALFEHVWFALICAAGVVAAFDEPVLAYLDVVVLGLCAFLGVGRVACLVVGCCHGQPSILGIQYGPAHVEDGFPTWLVGVRLFPVQLLEALGIGVIGVVGAVLLPFAPPGAGLVWFLVGYAILRFGAEGLRGDDRSTIAGLSLPRWMAIAQGGVAVAIADAPRMIGPAGAILAAVLLLTLALAAAWRRRSPERALRDPAVLEQIRHFVAHPDLPATPAPPITQAFPAGLTVAVSRARANPQRRHVSFAFATGVGDLVRLSEVSTAVVARPLPGSVHVSASGVLHLLADDTSGGSSVGIEGAATRAVYGAAVRSMQSDAEPAIDGIDVPASSSREAYFGPVPVRERVAATDEAFATRDSGGVAVVG
jgi:hypothetical protein